jgi:hypothetical protein
VNNRKLLRLSAIALATLGLYVLLAWRYPLGPSLTNARASWTSIVEPTWLNLALHLAIYLALTLLYLAALHILSTVKGESATHHRRQTLLILATWLACSAVLMTAAPAGESHDIFDYIFRGRMMVEYQANPLVDVPEELGISKPYARYVSWRKNVDTYGPVWEASSAAIAVSVRQAASWLGWWGKAYPVCPRSPESCRLLLAYITGYRLLSILLTGISGWLIASMVRRSQPTLATLALAVWLLNPIALVATALGGHNDAVMLVLVLLSWWLLQRQRPTLGLLALILAAHVKLTALIWLPTCALWILWRWGWRGAIKIWLLSAASGLALSWLLYAPFGGWQSLPRMLHERSLYLANSPWRILKSLLIGQWGVTIGKAHQLSIGLSNWLFAIGAFLISLWSFNLRPKRWRSANVLAEDAEQNLWRTLVAVSLLYLVVGSFWFQHWYILWVIAPAALLPGSRFTRVLLPWLTFGALSANVAMDFLLATALRTTPQILGYCIVVGIIWGPVVIAAGVHFYSGRTRLAAQQSLWKTV